MKNLILFLLIAALIAVGACHPKKMRPLETKKQTKVEEKVQPPHPKPETEQEITPIKPLEPQKTKQVELQSIHFDFDKYNLTDEAIAILTKNAEILLNNPDIEITIEGHCDERGTDEYNLALGEKRAMAARDFLVRFGIEKSRISIVSYGEERPLDPRHNEEAWAKNRRAEFVIR